MAVRVVIIVALGILALPCYAVFWCCVALADAICPAVPDERAD